MITENIKYILGHRKNIAKACDYWYREWIKTNPQSYDANARKFLRKTMKRIKWRHDLSKFSFKEFMPYAENFFGDKKCCGKCKHFLNCEEIRVDLGYDSNADNCKSYRYELFDEAVEHHYKHNKHHWKYWCYDWWKRDAYPEYDLNYAKLSTPIEMPTEYLIEMICDWTAMSYSKGGTPQEYYLENYHRIELNRYTRYELEIKLGLLAYKGPICQGNEEFWMTIEELKEYGCKLNYILKPVTEKYNIDFDDYAI